MSNALTSFDFEGSDLRFGTTDADVPYVVASDFGKALGYRDARDATRLLDDAEKGTQIVRTPGGPQEMSVIYEDGIWELVFRSTLPGAKVLKSRVKEILREIRKTGQYAPAPMSALDALAASVALLQEQERRTLAIEAQQAQISARQAAIEQRTEVLEENHDRVAAIGYASLRKIRTDVHFLNRLGRRASQIAKRDSIEISKVHSAIWGEVNAWPIEVWDEALEYISTRF